MKSMDQQLGHWVRAIALGLFALGGCGESLDRPSGFNHLLVASVCEKLWQCGNGVIEPDHCKQHIDSYGIAPPDIDDLVASGGYTYDRVAAAACLAALENASCYALALGSWGAPPCRAVIHGPKYTNEPCMRTVDCRDGWCDRTGASCPGKCARYAAKGGGCSSFDSRPCDEMSYCDPMVTCRPVPAEGGNACSGSDLSDCAAGLVCTYDKDAFHGLGTCKAPRGKGEPCTFAYELGGCVGGLYCDPASWHCVATKGDGTDCAANEECERGLKCIGVQRGVPGTRGVCRPILAIGAACTVDTTPFQQLETGCPSIAPCVNSTCGFAPEEGRACTSGFACGHGMFCDPDSHSCRWQVGFGEGCPLPTLDSGSPCATGRCDPASRRCADVCM